MPRKMPDLAGGLRTRFDSSLRLASSLELLRAGFKVGSREAALLHQSRIDAAYEASYLRMFVAWEDFLESTFVRFLCGYCTTTNFSAHTLVQAPSNLSSATTVMLGGQQYFLWHSPQRVVNKSKSFFTLGRHETVISSATARLESLGAVRHRIAHGQDDAVTKFDAATMSLCGKRYPGANPAAFLRDWVPNTFPRLRWIEAVADDLHGIAVQIVA